MSSTHQEKSENIQALRFKKKMTFSGTKKKMCWHFYPIKQSDLMNIWGVLKQQHWSQRVCLPQYIWNVFIFHGCNIHYNSSSRKINGLFPLIKLRPLLRNTGRDKATILSWRILLIHRKPKLRFLSADIFVERIKKWHWF